MVWQVAMAGGSLFAFALSLALWFATGNVLAPPIVWIGAAVWAGVMAPAAETSPVAPWVGTVGLLSAVALIAWGRARARPAAYLSPTRKQPRAEAMTARPVSQPWHAGELSIADLRLMRLILDRALQPVQAFDGFDWLDQFQTAAVRYQLNFASYALSMAHSVHLPAFDGYLTEAQHSLAGKAQDHRIWRYWQLESLWGNLDASTDPIVRDNVMFSGFLAAQLAWARNAGGPCGFDRRSSLVFAEPSGRRYAYSLPCLLRTLERNMAAAPFGLMPCEPNWIYPLCNTIAATALSAGDTAYGTSRWQRLEDRFETALLTEFSRPDGSFVPFRSSLTGLAGPAVGGAVMQAFPCFFLNATLPHLAARHWERTAPMLTEDRFRRALWPVDVGNYGFSRASSYAASAAAAREMGDDDVARRLLAALDEECPGIVVEGAMHRPRVSLWAHAVELMARCGEAGALARLINTSKPPSGPRLAHVPYPDILVARAVAADDGLDLVLHSDAGPARASLRFTGLMPRRAYQLRGSEIGLGNSDAAGEMVVDIPVERRTTFYLLPAEG
ncbi:MAG: hypothetical protein AAFV49_03885 [Pseudomonadota bacterium]